MSFETTSLDEIRAICRRLPDPDLGAGTAVRTRQAQLTKPPGSLGRLEDLAFWMATWQRRDVPRCDHPRIAVFAGNHGVAAARRVSAFPTAVTAQMVTNFQTGGGAVNQLAKLADADLQVHEMALEHPTADFTQGPAMAQDACARAIAYGMMAAQPGVDILALGEMGIGNTTSAAALCAGLFGGAPEDWVGPGTGVDTDGLERKRQAVADGLAANAGTLDDPFNVMACLGGHELAAILGAVIAARQGGIPVLLDGFTTTAAAAVLHAFDPRGLDHCVIAHVSAEPGHQRLIDTLGRKPLFDFGMRLGEASGAALAIPILKAAAACHADMATFDEARVSGAH